MTEKGLAYYGARYYSPELSVWYGVDPLMEKYPTFSPYVFCAGNPVKYIDPDGEAWITAEYEGEYFYYYDKNVSSQEDVIERYYNSAGTRTSDVTTWKDNCKRLDYNISYLGDEYVFEQQGQQFTLNKDGSYNVGNTTYSNFEYDKHGIHIGNDNNTSFVSNSNWYGNYLGPNNPTTRDSKYSYCIPPIDLLDYAAYLHDRDYDKLNANGPADALFNSTTYQADLNLAKRSQNVMNDQNKTNYSPRTEGWALRTYKLFEMLGKYKYNKSK